MIAQNLYIIAGSRSSGKSTFLKWCQIGDNAANLSAELAPLANFEEPIYFMVLGELEGSHHQDLLVHVDIFSPFAEILAPTQEALLDILSVESFAQYSNAQFLRRAENIYILTLHIPRIEILRRWISRCVDKNSPLIRTTMAQIYSDVYGDEPYNQLYKTWYDFIQTLPYKKSWHIIEQDENSYKLLEHSPDT